MFRTIHQLMLISATAALSTVIPWSSPAEERGEEREAERPYAIDFDTCADDELVISFNPKGLPYGLDIAGEYFRDEEGVELTRVYEDAWICDAVRDPTGMAAVYSVTGFKRDAADIREDLAAYLGKYADAVELNCPVLAQAAPAGMTDGWNIRAIDLDRNSVAKLNLAPLIALLDTGVDASHPAISGNIQTKAAYDFVLGIPETSDPHGHGTNMAGIIVNIAPDAQILPIRVLDGTGAGTWKAFGQGLAYAASQGADVANLSLGAPGEVPELVNRGIEDAATCWDMVMIAAAGNRCDEGWTCADSFGPANHEHIMSVAAVDSYGRVHDRAAGDEDDFVDLLAPGVLVCSSWSQTAEDVGPYNPYRRWTGSSIAAANTAAVAGLLRAHKRGSSAREVIATLVDNGMMPDPFHECAGALETRVLNACGALGSWSCQSRWDVFGPVDGLTCEGDEGALPDADTELEYLTPSSEPGCPVTDYETAELRGGGAMEMCPDIDTAPHACAAVLTSQPPKQPCPDCDAELVDIPNNPAIEVTLRLKSFNLANIDGMILRVNDGNKTYGYPLGDPGLPAGTMRATLNYVLDLQAQPNGPDISDASDVVVTLVTRMTINGTNVIAADPLNVY